MHRRSLFFMLFVWLLMLDSQVSAQSCTTRAAADSLLENVRLRVSRLNNQDPELISLHYLFAKDMQKELSYFNEYELPRLKQLLTEPDYYAVMAHYDKVSFYTRNVRDTLDLRRKKVDSLFYEKAAYEMIYENRQEAEYYADRALEYNRLNPDALLLKLNLLYDKAKFDECLELIHLLYNEAVLDREHEMRISDFTILFYDKLYFTGDSLVKAGHDAEALEVFSTLEQFCHNMPSNYCNDDYYKGILRSKTGVFNSYLAVAQAAIQRGNAQMARIFWQYAVEYKDANQGEILDEAILIKIEEELKRLPFTDSAQVSVDTENDRVSVEDIQSQDVALSPEEQLLHDLQDHEPVLDCDRLLVEGIDYCYKEEYKKAFDVLSKAKSIGTCGGEILDRLLRSLSQIVEEE